MTAKDPFAAPGAPGGGIDWKGLDGRLLLITARGIEPNVRTSLGEKDAIRADVIELDGPDAGTEHVETLIFPRVLQAQLKTKIDKLVIGRLGQGTAKPGQNAPWLLNEATDADKQLGMRWSAGTLTSPDGEQPPF
jgi:hypothetical protein